MAYAALLGVALWTGGVGAEPVKNGNELALAFATNSAAGKQAVQKQAVGALHTFRYLKLTAIERDRPETGNITLMAIEGWIEACPFDTSRTACRRALPSLNHMTLPAFAASGVFIAVISPVAVLRTTTSRPIASAMDLPSGDHAIAGLIEPKELSSRTARPRSEPVAGSTSARNVPPSAAPTLT